MKKMRRFFMATAAAIGVALSMVGCVMPSGTDTSVEARAVSALPAALDFQTQGFAQGIVTGRTYDELSQGPAKMNDFYNIGLGWIRIEFEEFKGEWTTDYNYPSIQTKKAMYQKLIANAKAKGLKVLGVIGNLSFPWKEYETDPGTPNFPRDATARQKLIDSIEWHLKNYPDLAAIEIWNELSKKFVKSTGNLRYYASLLVDSYKKLKPLYPSTLFVGPCTVNAEEGDWLNSADPEDSIFNTTVMQNYRKDNSGKLPFDIFSWHPYGNLTNEDPDGIFYGTKTFDQYFDDILKYKDKTGRNVIGNYPIWFTEYGWNTNIVSEEDQRIFFERMIKRVYQTYKRYSTNGTPRVNVAFLYNYRDDEPKSVTNPDSENKAFGILKNSVGKYARKRVFFPFVAHSALAGLCSIDGVQEWTVDEIVREYMNNGGRSAFGYPFRQPAAPLWGDKVHYWGPNDNGYLQEFRDGTYGVSAIGMRREWKTAFTVQGNGTSGFYKQWMDAGGAYNYGWPTANQVTIAGVISQTFEHGTLKKNNGTFTWTPK